MSDFLLSPSYTAASPLLTLRQDERNQKVEAEETIAAMKQQHKTETGPDTKEATRRRSPHRQTCQTTDQMAPVWRGLA